MSNYKNNGVPPVVAHETAEAPAERSAQAAGKAGYESTLRNGRVRNLVTPEGRDMGGWDSYRRWLNRVQSPEKRRSPVDAALYTWKGYRSWSEKVRRDWKQED